MIGDVHAWLENLYDRPLPDPIIPLDRKVFLCIIGQPKNFLAVNEKGRKATQRKYARLLRLNLFDKLSNLIKLD